MSDERFRRHAGFAMLATMFALVASYLNQVLASAVFGMGHQLDAYVATNALSNVAVVAVGGSFAIAIATRSASTDPGSATADVAFPVGVFALVAVAVLSLSAPISDSLAHNAYSIDPSLVRRVLTVNTVAMVLNVGATVAGAVIVGQGRTMLGLASPVAVSAGGAVGAVVFGPTYGVTALAVGTAIGACTRLIVLLLAMRKAFPTAEEIRSSARFLARSVELMGASLVVALVMVTDKVALAPFPSGTVSRTSFGVMLLFSAGTVMSSALGTPLAKHFAAAEGADRWERAAAATRASVLFVLPVALFVLLAAEPIAGLLLGWGKVGPADIHVIAETMRLGGGVVLVACMTSVPTYIAGLGDNRLLLLSTTLGGIAAVALFFGARHRLGPAAVPLGYSALHVIPTAILITAFLRQEREKSWKTLRGWLRAAAPGVAGGALALGVTVGMPQSLRTRILGDPLVEMVVIASLMVGASFRPLAVRASALLR